MTYQEDFYPTQRKCWNKLPSQGFDILAELIRIRNQRRHWQVERQNLV